MNALYLRVLQAIAAADATVQFLVKLTLLLAAAWMLQALFARANPRWRVLLWRGTAASALLMLSLWFAGPTIHASVPPPIEGSAAPPTVDGGPMDSSPAVIAGDVFIHGRGPRHQAESAPTPAQPPLAVPARVVADAASAQRPAAAAHSWTTATWLWIVWGIGLLVGAIRESVALVRLGRLRRRAVAADAALTARAVGIADRLKLRKPFEVLVTGEIVSPCVVGAWRAAILLPSGYDRPSDVDELTAVLAHEIQHLKNADLLWNTLLRGVAHLLWFHPLAWRMRSAHAAACDAVCDAAAADFIGDLQTYCRTLARLALRAAAPLPAAALSMARASSARRRIEALKRQLYVTGLPRWAVLIAIFLGLGGAGLIGTTQLTLNQGEAAEAEKPPAAGKQSTGKSAAGAAAAKPAAQGKISGTVTGADGKPLAGVTVEIYSGQPRSAPDADSDSGDDEQSDTEKKAITDAAGHFSLDDLDASLEFDVLAIVAGYRVQMTKQVDPTAARPLEIKLDPWKVPDDPACVVQGVILDPDGKPVVDALIQPGGWEEAGFHVHGSPPFVDMAAATDSSGKFVLISDKPVLAIDLDVITDHLGRHNLQAVPTGAKENRLQLKRGSTVAGRVVRDGHGVGGVKVAAAQINRASESFVGEFTAKTDADGRFSIPALPANEEMAIFGLMSSFRELGSLPARQFTTAEEGTFDLGDLPLAKACRVSGRIVMADGKPIPAGARVFLSRTGAWDHQTVLVDPATRRFVFTGVPAEIVSLMINLPGYQVSPKNKSYDPTRGDPPLEGQIVGDVDNLLVLCERERERPDRFGPEGRAAFARYRRTRTEPLAGVTETLETPPLLPDFKLPPELSAPASGWKLPVPKVTIPGPQPAPPPADALPAKTLFGTVTDDAGKPVAGAQLWLPVEWEGKPAHLVATNRSDAQGRYRLSIPEVWLTPLLNERNWYVLAYAPGHSLGGGNASAQLQYLADEPCDAKLRPETNASVVVTLPDGRPAVGAKVAPALAAERHVTGEDWPSELIDKLTGTTDADGRARMPALSQPELSDLAISLNGFGRQLFYLYDRDDDSPDPALELRAAGRIEGRLVTDQLELVRGLWVTARSNAPSDGGDAQAQGQAIVKVNDQGRFVIPELASGRLWFRTAWDMSLPIRPRQPDDLSLDAGGTLQVEIPLETCTRVHGVVRIAGTKQPVAGARLWVGDVNHEEGIFVLTDAEGNYSGYVLPADWIMTQVVETPSGQLPRERGREQFRVPRGRKDFTLKPIELAPTTMVAGKLVGPDGKPLAGVKVHGAIGDESFYAAKPTDASGAFSIQVPAVGEIESFQVQFGDISVKATIQSADPLVIRGVPLTKQQIEAAFQEAVEQSTERAEARKRAVE